MLAFPRFLRELDAAGLRTERPVHGAGAAETPSRPAALPCCLRQGNGRRTDRNLAGRQLEESEDASRRDGLRLEVRRNLYGSDQPSDRVEHVPRAVRRLEPWRGAAQVRMHVGRKK